MHRFRVAIVLAWFATAGAAQGALDCEFTGRVLRPDGTISATARVVVMPTVDPLSAYLADRSRAPLAAHADTTTDGQGRFVAKFSIDLAASLSRRVDVRVLDAGCAELRRVVTVDRRCDVGDLRLEPGACVRGRVLSPDGSPCVHAEVRVLAGDPGAPPPVPGREGGILVRTDARGEFVVAEAPRTGAVHLRVDAPGAAPLELLDQRLRGDGADVFELRLVAGEALTGRVVDEAGHAIAAAVVRAMACGARTVMTASTTTDADGAFAFSALRPGDHALVADAPGHREPRPVILSTGTRDARLQLDLLNVRVLVRDVRGEPVRRYRATIAEPGSAPTARAQLLQIGERDHDGARAALPVAVAGRFVLQVKATGCGAGSSQPFAALRGQIVEVDVRLTAGRSIRGVVVDDHGRPVRGARVEARSEAAREWAPFHGPAPLEIGEVTTAADGSFRIDGLDEPEQILSVSHPDFSIATTRASGLADGEVRDLGRLAIERGTLVAGIVRRPRLDLRGQILLTSKAAAGPGDTSPPPLSLQTPMRDDGTFEFPLRIPPGDYEVSWLETTDNLFGSRSISDVYALKVAPRTPRQDIEIRFDGR